MTKEEITKLTDREMEDLICILEEELSKREEKRKKEKQEKCKHRFVFIDDGYGHNECSICGKWS